MGCWDGEGEILYWRNKLSWERIGWIGKSGGSGRCCGVLEEDTEGLVRDPRVGVREKSGFLARRCS